MRCYWFVFAVLAFAWVLVASGQEPATPKLTPLPEGNTGIAAKYPGDQGIEKDPAVVFADGFENGMGKWDSPYGKPHITREAENVHHGEAAVEMVLEWPRTDRKFNNGLMQHFRPGFDVLFFRYYAKFGKETELYDGGTHAGGAIFATTMETDNIKAGLRADGRNQFTARLDTWRGQPDPFAGPPVPLLLPPRASVAIRRPTFSLRPGPPLATENGGTAV